MQSYQLVYLIVKTRVLCNGTTCRYTGKAAHIAGGINQVEQVPLPYAPCHLTVATRIRGHKQPTCQ
jgi:hypothetical protein